MSDRHLTAVPPTEGAPSAPPDGPHPIEVARRALREAALAEADAFWAEQCRRFADALPDRGALAFLLVLRDPVSVCARVRAFLQRLRLGRRVAVLLSVRFLRLWGRPLLLVAHARGLPDAVGRDAWWVASTTMDGTISDERG